jgi:trimethylamine--corrinoid protein Co-methyltransferase
MQGITLHDVDEEVALIKANTPRGNFLRARHTRRTFREHWLPEILNRDSYETWQAKGRTIEQVCRSRAQDLLEQHRPPPLPAGAEAELERIVRRYLGPDFHFGQKGDSLC